MAETKLQIALSPLDEAHFGYRTATASFVTAQNLPEVMDFCSSNDVEFLISRCSAEDLEAVQSMEKNGFQLMDTLLYFKLWLGNESPFPKRNGIEYRSVKPGEEEQVRDIARLAFQGYGGHYHADHRLEQSKCDEVYAKWVYQACLTPSSSKDVLVFYKQDELVAFVIVEINDDDFGVPLLSGINPVHQGIGVYATIAYATWTWFKNNGLLYSVASTQITNFAQQKYFNRFKYKPTNAVYTLHKWFD